MLNHTNMDKNLNFTELALIGAEPYWQGSFRHPFIKDLHAGTLKPEIFRYYLLQDRYYLEHFAKIYQMLSLRSEDTEIKELMKNNFANLQAGELFIREQFFQDLNITATEIARVPIAPTAYHYISHIYRQFVTGSDAVVCAALLPCPWLYYEIGKVLSARKSPVTIFQRWIETYVGEDAAAAIEKEKSLLNKLFRQAQPAEREAMLEAFIISSQMEYLFWEMAYTMEKTPVPEY